jgi:hypothetical protein
MGDFVVFTPEIAEALIMRGFDLVLQTETAYYFNDTEELLIAIGEIMAQMVD